MSPPRCPGQDPRYWKPDDIFYVDCPQCGAKVEFWKDEPVRPCPACQAEVRNSKLGPGCAAWCRHADECQPPRRPDQDATCEGPRT